MALSSGSSLLASVGESVTNMSLMLDCQGSLVAPVGDLRCRESEPHHVIVIRDKQQAMGGGCAVDSELFSPRESSAAFTLQA